MNPALNGGSLKWRFKNGNAIKIRDEAIFDFDTGLSYLDTEQ